MLSDGTVIHGYRVEGFVGRGGMGEVYRATQLGLNRIVALKIVSSEHAAADGFVERFRRESELAASLDHPNLLPIYEAGQVGDQLFLSMRYVDGPDLARLLASEGPLPPPRASAMVGQIASALDAAHAAGLVHRDVKPANVLVERAGTADERAYLADFGLAKPIRGTGANLTRTGHVVGTVDYLAPEQITSGHADARSDVYALGCLLVELVSGTAPFSRETDVATLWAHVHDQPPRLADSDPGLAGLDPVVRRALAKPPTERYASAGELAGAVRAAAVTDAAPAGEVRRRRRRTAVAAGVVGLVLVAGVGVALALRDDDAPGTAAEPTTGEQTAAAAGSGTNVETAAAAPPPTSVEAPPVAASNTVAEFGADGDAPARVVGVGDRPTLVAADGDVLWVANAGDRTLSRVDIATGAVRAIGTTQVPTGLAVADDSVWVSGGYADAVTRLDRDTGAVRATIPVSGGPNGILATDDAVWVAVSISGDLVRIDPNSNEVAARVPIGGQPTAVAATPDAIWVATRSGQSLVRVDPATGKVARRIGLRFGADGVAATPDGVWVVHTASDTLSFVDAERDAVTRTVELDGQPAGAAVVGDELWVALSRGRALARLDAGTGEERGTVPVDANPIAVAAAASGSGVWATFAGDATALEPPTAAYARGGTLKVLADPLDVGHLDPHWQPRQRTAEIGRCCLHRSLMAYPSLSAEDGGTIARPDLATAYPDVSEDRRTWTFTIREGLRYAPPFDDVEITAGDFVRTFERTVRRAPEGVEPGNTVGSFGAAGVDIAKIQGAEEFAAGEADTIAGLETPDDHTLVIRLKEPDSDLAETLLAQPQTGPTPPGAADGHDTDYEAFQVSSGPYMIEGADRDDLTKPASGLVPGKSLTLVRNPSWSAEDDPIRPAYADRIEIDLVPRTMDFEKDRARSLAQPKRVERGEYDAVLDRGSTFVDPKLVARYRKDPELRRRMVVSDDDQVEYLALRLSVPPFDDVHVRRAVNFIVDKRAYLDFCCVASGPAQHVMINSTLDGLLIDYAPYASPNSAGDVARARAEMAQSRYDTDKDGRCDAAACRSVRSIELRGYELPYPEFEKIGLKVETTLVDQDRLWIRAVEDPTEQWAFMHLGYAKSSQGPSDQFEYFFESTAIGAAGQNASLVGATDEQLEAWGSPVRGLPSMDAKIEECRQLVGVLATQCWADATRIVTEDIVPVVPMIATRSARFFSARVLNPAVGGVYSMPTLDALALSDA